MFVQVAAGQSHTCGLASGGITFCWGWNNYGQLGDGTQADRPLPTPVIGNLSLSKLGVGWQHTCGFDGGGGAAFCWGYQPLRTARNWLDNRPGDASSGPDRASIHGTRRWGQSHLWHLTPGEKAYCWGFNADGELGNGGSQNQLHTPFRYPVA